MKQARRPLVDYRRLARRNLPSLLTYKFLNECGYDKGQVVVKCIVDDEQRGGIATLLMWSAGIPSHEVRRRREDRLG